MLVLEWLHIPHKKVLFRKLVKFPPGDDLDAELTKSTEDRVGEPVTNSELPLRRHDQTYGRSEEEVGNKYVGGGHATPLYQTQRQSSKCRCKYANW